MNNVSIIAVCMNYMINYSVLQAMQEIYNSISYIHVLTDNNSK